PDGGYGVCGMQLQNSDRIVTRCNKGKDVDTTVHDLYSGCGSNGIELSSSAF
ncbi:uncharacterized protein EV420DRAFT_1271642, partial [Desarmillaria tabescens]